MAKGMAKMSLSKLESKVFDVCIYRNNVDILRSILLSVLSLLHLYIIMIQTPSTKFYKMTNIQGQNLGIPQMCLCYVHLVFLKVFLLWVLCQQETVQ